MGRKNINVAVGGYQSGDYHKVYNTEYIKPNIPIALQVTKPETKYVIRHEFTLDNGNISIPKGCLLEYDGGAISNGTIVCNDTIIEGDVRGNAVFTGTYSDWSLGTIDREIAEVREDVEEVRDEIPTSLSQLLGDPSHRIVTDEEKSMWNGKAEFSVVNARLDEQDDKIELLNGNDVIVVDDHTAVSEPDSQKIYREYGTDSYTDWMCTDVTATPPTWQIIATYAFPGVEDKPQKGSEKLVSSDGVYSVLEEGMKTEADISEITEIIPELTEGHFIYDDGEERSNQYLDYRKYHVTGGKNYLFSSVFDVNTDIHFLLWFDANDEKITYEPYAGSDSSVVRIVDQIVTAPANAAYAYLNSCNVVEGEVGMKEVTKTIKSQDIVDMVNTRVIPYISEKTMVTSIQVEHGKFYYDDGAHINEHIDYYKYSVLPNRLYTFSSGFGENTNIWFVYWLDSSENIIKKEPYHGNDGEGSDPVVYVDQPISSPSNASYMILNVCNYMQIDHNVKIVGDPLHLMPVNDFLESCNLNDVKESGTWLLIESNEYQNVPSLVTAGFLRVSEIKDSNYVLQELYDFTGHVLYNRRALRDEWTSWGKIGGETGLLESTDLNNVTQSGFYLLSDYQTYQNAPKLPDGGYLTYGWLEVSIIDVASRWCLQVATSFDGEYTFKRRGSLQTGVFLQWVTYRNSKGGILPNHTDLNQFYDEGTYILIDDYSYDNVPNNQVVGWLRVTRDAGRIVLQEFYDWFDGLFKRQFFTNHEERPDFQRISGGGNTYNNTYNFNEYIQTVNLSCSPSITTDTNNYLASTNNTDDRTSDILAMLQSTGVCHLGPGIFWVDSLIMPDDSSLIGSGTATKVFLKSGENKFAIKMGSRCMVKDMHILGKTSDITISAAGTRDGILWQGDYSHHQDWTTQPTYGTIEGVYLCRFDRSGIRCYDTGYPTFTYVSAVNCHIWNCHIGVNVEYWSEFNKFTNVRCSYCYFGCVNNGGNNTFVNCDFSSSSYVAFLMDNSQGQSPNNSHGSCVGCVFNHTANNTGDGIVILNCDNGFVFDGCQIFFSKINVEDSYGIVFSSCTFGQSNCDISVSRGGLVLFANNTHQGTPPSISIVDNTKVHFVNCYDRNTGNIINI